MSGATLEIRSPGDGGLLATFSVAGVDDVRRAVAAARTAQREWGILSPTDRARRLRRAARVFAEREAELVDTIRRETGKPSTEAVAEVLVTVDLIRYYARVAPRHLRTRRVGTGWLLSRAARVDREPYGVVGAITPWNYPLVLVMEAVTPALFAGNAVVVKPSEATPLTALKAGELLGAAGIPEGLVQVVVGNGTTGEALVEAGVDRIHFTGSSATGRKVMASAARTLTPVTLELGGKDPAIVLEDADLDRAARGVVFGAFFNAGQTCISVERVYVVRQVYAHFLAKVVEAARTLRATTEGDHDVGPVIAPAQMAVIERHIEDAVARGARVLTGGRRTEPGSRVILPTVLADVGDAMEVMREETFGPLLPIAAVEDEDEAVRRANASGFGLFASVWTGDRRRGLRIARRLRAGGVSVNDVLSHFAVPALPMGGVGDSGFGRRRGVEALDEMTRTRTLLEDRGGLRKEPYWFPYSTTTERLLRALLLWRGIGGIPGAAALVRTLTGRKH